ncbi:MAG: phosphoribosylglycinamide formyltransferase [Psychrilyobacter sp.]|uniref:phosphoribosylglycinamide formyltransferase n=1 Tax=Psychrilyobacter sp. TaxID=2586924 RepID=UPI003C792327
MFKIAVLISGGGSNLQSIIDNVSTSKVEYEISCVIADRECYGIERAEQSNIVTKIFDRKILKKDISKKIDEYLEKKVDLIVLAGFLSILDENFINNRRGRIINIHPSLLPKFGGPGMFGMKIHRAVIEAKESESGCTVHYVDVGIDEGEIIEQIKVKVDPEDNAEILQKKVLVEEHKLLPRAIERVLYNFK